MGTGEHGAVKVVSSYQRLVREYHYALVVTLDLR